MPVSRSGLLFTICVVDQRRDGDQDSKKLDVVSILLDIALARKEMKEPIHSLDLIRIGILSSHKRSNLEQFIRSRI